MPTFVSDCPRCGAAKSTFDCYSNVWRSLEHGWLNRHEIFCVCRTCHCPSIQLVKQTNNDNDSKKFCSGINTMIQYNGSLNDLVKFERFITLRDKHSNAPPEHLPKNLDAVMREANSSLAGQCWNAAGAMYRLALDISTKSLLSDDGEPSARTRRSLGLRIQWLFDNGELPDDLHKLAECLREDGNDGAHDGTLKKVDAEDLHDFCFELLRRLYTEPERVRLAQERRNQRRSDPT